MNDWTDDELMALLAEAVAETDAVTERRRAAAQAAFTWRDVDAELMELLHDSALEAGAAVRSTGQVSRVLSFGRGAFTLELEVSRDVILGQLIPGRPGTVVVQQIDVEPTTVATDGSGFFRIEGIEGGLVRFVVTADGQTLTTAWVHV
jgi:hypothetical protein